MTIAQIQIRRGTAAQWTSNNPILGDGEWGLETDTGKVKLGLGSVSWTGLPYHPSATTDLTLSGALVVNGNTSLGNSTSDTTSISGDLDVARHLTVDGNATLGDSTSDTVTTAGDLTVGRNLLAKCRAFGRSTSANQSIANNSLVKVTAYGASDFDTDTANTFYSYSSGTITVLRTAVYIVSGRVVFNGDSGGVRRGGTIKVNGSQTNNSVFIPPVGTQATSMPYSDIHVLSANDTIELFVFQDSGAALNLIAGTTLHVAMIGTA